MLNELDLSVGEAIILLFAALLGGGSVMILLMAVPGLMETQWLYAACALLFWSTATIFRFCPDFDN